MTSETGNGVTNDNQQSFVQFVGNSWIICNSTSRPGHKYYFNSLTGESVWNLSFEEMEKAKKHTKAVPTDEIERCPEPPLDAPMDSEQSTTSRAHNKQIVNNQFPNQYSNMFPINLLSGIHGVPSVSAVNHNIWTTPPNNASIPPGFFQPPINHDVQQQQEFFQNLQIPDSKYMHAQEQCPQRSHQNKHSVFDSSDYVASNRGRPNNYWHKKWTGNKIDLRQKLTRKRSMSQSSEPKSCEELYYRERDNDDFIKNKDLARKPKMYLFTRDLKTPGLYISGNTDSGSEFHFLAVRIKKVEAKCFITLNTHAETPSKYNLSAVKQLRSKADSKGDKWFIVVDMDILLHNFPFLNKIMDPVQNCYLMVPDHVFLKLQHLARTENDVNARRIYRFLSGQINSGLAFKGVTQLADNDIEKTLWTCDDLAKQNNVILLSNNIDDYKYKQKKYNIQLLTLNEFRMILNDEPGSQILRSQGSPTLAVKIVVRNEKKSAPIEDVTTRSRQFRSETSDYEEPSCTHTSKRKEVSIQSDTLPILSKQTVDTGVQVGDLVSECTDSFPRILKTPYSTEFQRELGNSFFSNYPNAKETDVLHSGSSQKEPLQTLLNKTNEVNIQSETICSLSKQPVESTGHGIPKEINFDNNKYIYFGLRPENDLNSHVVNSLDTSDSVELERDSEGSYVSSNLKRKNITSLYSISNQKAPQILESVQKQRPNTLSETIPSLSKQIEGDISKDIMHKFKQKETSQKKLVTPPNICEAVLEGIENNLKDFHFCKNPTKLKSQRSVSNQRQDVEKNTTQTTKYKWRRQRGNLSSQMNMSQSSFVIASNFTGSDLANPHEPNSAENPGKLESGLRLVPPEGSSRDPSLERSSISSQPKTTGRPSCVIEETSSSGVISNTTNDSESMTSIITKQKKTITVRQAEMFEVAGQGMEDVLRTRREEWILRFVQIMEEVLREKLRDSSPFQSKDYAASWATDLPELARCIIQKYINYFNVVDAANKLSLTLYRISDEKGNMDPNIEPNQYMEMYSFGVYLVETLQDISDDCEDLKAADKSLKKLLYDIRNCNLDATHQDTFVDELQESVMDTSEPICAADKIQPHNTVNETSEDDLDSSKNSYRLRSREKKPTQIVIEAQHKTCTTATEKTPKNVEKTFFFSLELEKKTFDDANTETFDLQQNQKSTNVVKHQPIVPPLPKCPPAPAPAPSSPKSSIVLRSPKVPASPKFTQCSPKSPQRSPQLSQSSATFTHSSPKIPQSLSNGAETSPKKQVEERETSSIRDADFNKQQVSNDPTVPTAQPIIVRNFSSIAQFEEKLIRKMNVRYDINNDLSEDYEDEHYDESEYPHDHYGGAGEHDGTEGCYVNNIGETDEYDERQYDNFELRENEEFGDADVDDVEDGEICEGTKDASDVEGKLDDLKKEKNERFRCLVKKFVEEIRQSLMAVEQLIIEFVAVIKTPLEPSEEIKGKLKIAQTTLLKISNSLNSILDRESRKTNNSMTLLLKRANLEDFLPDEDIRLKYMNLIDRCREQTHATHKLIFFLMKSTGIQDAADPFG